MAFSREDIEANREHFAAKLRAEKQKADVAQWAKGEAGAGDFLLLDARHRGGFNKSHIQGALCVPVEELAQLIGKLPKDRELVTYCWNQT